MTDSSKFDTIADKYIRDIIGNGDVALCVHIYINGFLMYDVTHGATRKSRLEKHIFTSIEEAFPDAVITPYGEGRFHLVTKDGDMNSIIKLVHDRIQEGFHDTGISVKAGGYRVVPGQEAVSLDAMMRGAEDACNSIVLFSDICYRQCN